MAMGYKHAVLREQLEASEARAHHMAQYARLSSSLMSSVRRSSAPLLVRTTEGEQRATIHQVQSFSAQASMPLPMRRSREPTVILGHRTSETRDGHWTIVATRAGPDNGDCDGDGDGDGDGGSGRRCDLVSLRIAVASSHPLADPKPHVLEAAARRNTSTSGGVKIGNRRALIERQPVACDSHPNPHPNPIRLPYAYRSRIIRGASIKDEEEEKEAKDETAILDSGARFGTEHLHIISMKPRTNDV